jgi:hypothetical protein
MEGIIALLVAGFDIGSLAVVIILGRKTRAVWKKHLKEIEELKQ